MHDVVAPTKPFTPTAESGARLALTGVFVNCALAGIKIVSGIVGHSYVLIADGIESILDIFGSLVIWGGLRVAALPPDETHPYGHGKAESLAAVVVALTVLAAGVGLAIQSVREIVTPHHGPAPFTLLVLILVVAVKEALFRKVIETGELIDSTAVKADAWHHRSDAITSAAAFVGITIALIGGPGWEPADDWAALFACGLIGFNGWRLLVPAIGEAMDTAPPLATRQEVRAVASAVPGVVDVEKFRLRKTGLHFYADIHLGVKASLTVREGHAIAHAVKDAIRASHPSVVDVLVHVEPAEETHSHAEEV